MPAIDPVQLVQRETELSALAAAVECAAGGEGPAGRAVRLRHRLPAAANLIAV